MVAPSFLLSSLSPTSSTAFFSLSPFKLLSLSPFHSHLLVLHIVVLFALCIPLQQLAQLNSHAPTFSSTPLPFFFTMLPLLVLSRNVMCIFLCYMSYAWARAACGANVSARVLSHLSHSRHLGHLSNYPIGISRTTLG